VLLAVLIAALTAMSFAQRPAAEPFIPVSVWYPPNADVDAMRRDFTLIRNAGFNAVTTWTTWKEGEPRQGVYSLLGIDRVIAVAAENDLKVLVQVLSAPAPSWAGDVPNLDASRFFDYVRRRVASQTSVVAVDQTSSAPTTGEFRAIVDGGEGSVSVRKARKLLWSALTDGVSRFGVMDRSTPASQSVLTLGGVAGVIARNAALFAPLKPRRLTAGDVTIDGEGPVTVSVLESMQALVIVAFNHATAVRKMRITFAPGFPEAIWQNMEEGTTVNLVAGPRGPFLDYTFAPEDVLVLAIAKRWR
jgi:hypothetical protein